MAKIADCIDFRLLLRCTPCGQRRGKALVKRKPGNQRTRCTPCGQRRGKELLNGENSYTGEMHSVRTAPWQSNNYKQYVNEIQDALRADSAVAKPSLVYILIIR